MSKYEINKINKNYSTTTNIHKSNYDEFCKIINAKHLDRYEFKTNLRLFQDSESILEGGLRTKGYFKVGGLVKLEEIDCDINISYNKYLKESKLNKITNNPLITIITVVLNGEKYLEQAIQSVITQNYNNIEYIIVDGGSADKTLDIIKKYDDLIDYWVSKKDAGIYDAMNRGIKLALGEYIGFVNADDFIYPEAISTFANKINELDFDYTLGPIDICDSEGKIKETALVLKGFSLNNLFLNDMPAHHLSFYIRTEYLKKIGLFDLQYKIRSDYDMMIRAIKNSKLYCVLNYSMGGFREGGISGSYKTFFEGYKIMTKYKVSLPKKFMKTARSLLIVFINRNCNKNFVKWLRTRFYSGRFEYKKL